MKIESIKELIYKAIENDFPFVIYRKPESSTLQLVIQNEIEVNFSRIFEEKGFVFAPFDLSQDTVLFPYSKSNFHKFDIEKQDIKDKFNVYFDSNLNNSILEKENHINLVNKAIDFIRTGSAEKIVISRKLPIKFHEESLEFKLKTYFNLIFSYPEAMVYWWQHPKIGIWMGATPEKFISISENTLKTVALAGTQAYKDNLVWQKKEKEEQGIVVKFIQNELKYFCSAWTESKPYTKKAGHLAHICTEMEGNVKKDSNLHEILTSLHPTPAVCGTPKEIAKQFIIENEGYDRKFYTGFFGIIDQLDDTDLYVNLRCMEWTKNAINLYTGGGITTESIAEKEWEETVNKSKVMGRTLLLKMD